METTMKKQTDYAKLLLLLEGERGFENHPKTTEGGPSIYLGERVALRFGSDDSLTRIEFIDRNHYVCEDLTFVVRKARQQ
jgi:hypothetical protein